MTAFDGLQFDSDFKTVCGDEAQEIQVDGKIPVTAVKDFNLFSEEDIIGFISGGGLEKVTYVKAENWRSVPEKEAPLLNHVYDFSYGTADEKGYLSIAYMPKRKKWKLKSFKKFDKKQHLRVLRKGE
ncbi:MAG: hypothetical protein ACI8PD_002219 [Nitrospinales bacterium]